MDRLAVVVAAVALLGGCVGALPEGVADDPVPAPEGDAPTRTGTPPTSNPWGADPVVVAVEGTEAHVAAVRDATSYWERVDERYLDYAVEYAVRPNASDPDLVVAFVDDIPDCAGSSDAVGCAPLVRSTADVDPPVRAYVVTGLSAESTRLVAKHELGHTLGLDHDDPPGDVMAAESVLYTSPQPDATERALPWANATLGVRVDVGNASNPRLARQQVGRALDYLADGPEGVPANVTFDRRPDASPDVVIRVGAGCSDGDSCLRTTGVDPDGDGRIERYTRAEIRTGDLDTAAVGWHVGYWLSYALGAEDDADKPPPFRSASYEERRSEWWR